MTVCERAKCRRHEQTSLYINNLSKIYFKKSQKIEIHFL